MHIWLTGKNLCFPIQTYNIDTSLWLYIHRAFHHTIYFSCESIDVFVLFLFFLLPIYITFRLNSYPLEEIFFVCIHSVIHQLFNWHSATPYTSMRTIAKLLYAVFFVRQNIFGSIAQWTCSSLSRLITILNYTFFSPKMLMQNPHRRTSPYKHQWIKSSMKIMKKIENEIGYMRSDCMTVWRQFLSACVYILILHLY